MKVKAIIRSYANVPNNSSRNSMNKKKFLPCINSHDNILASEQVTSKTGNVRTVQRNIVTRSRNH